MLILIVVSWLLVAAYAALMLIYRYGWMRQPYFVADKTVRPETFISIVIPARNEERNIAACIHSILENDYPSHLFEIIVVDDHSDDGTTTVVSQFRDNRIRLVSLADRMQGERLNAYKKKALTIGIEESRGTLIVTTDADCILPPAWLGAIAGIYQAEDPVMIVGPVDFTGSGKLVELFQAIDFMTMQGITGASHRLRLGNMSNGANLAFSKTAFRQVDGYTGIDHLASGDDFLLMMKLQRAFPGRIAYLKSEHAIVRTAPQPDWGSFLNQRIRWASKSGKYSDHKITAVLLLVYSVNLMLLLLTALGFCDGLYWQIALGILLLKTGVELFFLLPVARFFSAERRLTLFPLLQPLHIIYIVLAGFLGFIGVYKWKGRRVK